MTALTTQEITIVCLFVVFIYSPTLVRKWGALPVVAAVTVQGGAEFNDPSKTMTIEKLHPQFIWIHYVIPLF